MEVSHTVINLIIFVLAIYVGYHVVWTVTPALHTPLMAVTNAVSAIIITTALIPGRKAPILISEDTVKSMKPGSVIVDMAVEQGGNCPLSELGKTVIKHGVTIIGESNIPALCGADASALYSRNVLDFLKLIINPEGALHIDTSDEIVAATLMCSGGEVVRKA